MFNPNVTISNHSDSLPRCRKAVLDGNMVSEVVEKAPRRFCVLEAVCTAPNKALHTVQAAQGYRTQEPIAPGATVVLAFGAGSGSVVRNGPPCTDGGSHERRSAKHSAVSAGYAGSAGTGRYPVVSRLRQTSHNRQ